MVLESELRKEINKWTERMEEEMGKLEIKPEKEHLLENINAYVKDSRHFLEQGDLIRSFEAIIWAWAWTEILKELRIFKK